MPNSDKNGQRMTWAIAAWRGAHALVALGFLGAIVHVWRCALTGRRDRWLGLSIGSLVAEGTFVAANHGDCPLGPLGERIGDPVPLFELVLPPKAAKRAVPVLGGVAGTGILLVAIRGVRSS
jgi:hypothetical protein